MFDLVAVKHAIKFTIGKSFHIDALDETIFFFL